MRIMSYFGHVIYRNSAGYFTIAKGDGTDYVCETIDEAMNLCMVLHDIKHEDIEKNRFHR